MEHNLQTIHEQEIEAYLIELRGQKVLLDRDVAMLYGVETKRVNEAVKIIRKDFRKGIFFHCKYLKNSIWSKISTASIL